MPSESDAPKKKKPAQAKKKASEGPGKVKRSGQRCSDGSRGSDREDDEPNEQAQLQPEAENTDAHPVGMECRKEHAAASVRNDPPEQERSLDKDRLRHYGALACLLLLLFASVAVVVFVAILKEPKASVKSALLTDIKLTTSEVTFVSEVQVEVENPNMPPIECSAEKAYAKLWLFDAAANDAKAIPVGSAYAKEPVAIKAGSEERLSISASGSVPIRSEAGILLQRVLSDCGGTQTVKLRALVTATLASAVFVDLDRMGVEITVETHLPCSSIAP